MIRNHLKMAFRILSRNRLSGVINAVGLALGLGTFLLVAAYVTDEWAFDRFHERADRLHRLVGEYTDEAGTRSYARVPPAVVPTLLSDVPDVESGVRLQRTSLPVRVGDQVLRETDYYYSDPSFFDLFTFPLLNGDPASALKDPYTLVISESAARRYFGATDVVGRSVIVDDTLQLTVTGVARDVPARSHLKFTGLVSFSTFERIRPGYDLNTLWSWGTFYSYVMLSPESSMSVAQERITRAIDDRLGAAQEDGIRFSARLQPLKQIHLHSEVRQEMSPGGSATNVYVFGLIGMLVLVIAGINFVNLSTAQGSKRAREVGVRKAAGASKKQLVAQFTIEAVTLSVFALTLAILLVVLALPVLNQISGKTFAPSDIFRGPFILGGLFLASLTGFLAGLYPSLYLSSYRPAAVLRAGQPSHSVGQKRLRQVLVIAQFSASISLIGATIVALHQVSHLRSQDPGFNREHIAVLPFHWDDVVQKRYETLREGLLALSATVDVAASGDVPGRMFTSMSIWGEGMPPDTWKEANALIVDPDFAETYQLEVIAGRDFSRAYPTDWDEGFMLNESAVRLLGWTPEEAIGKTFYMNQPGTVVGVYRDFHYEGVQTAIEPIAFAMWPSWYGYFSVRLREGPVAPAIADLESVWRTVVPDRPFELYFLDQDFDALYRSEARFGKAFLTLAVLAILIACLGLYGLAAFIADRRRKEVGIRKVLGAGVAGLTALLSRDFVMLVGVAFVVAAPTTWLVMQRWLSTFASHIDLSVWPFLAAGAVALLAALIPIGFHTMRAASANPVQSLRYE